MKTKTIDLLNDKNAMDVFLDAVFNEGLIDAVKARSNNETLRDNARIKRNEGATKLFKMARTFKIGVWEVETWWDRFSRNWITTLRDGEGYDGGSSEYSGEQLGAAISHYWAIKKAYKHYSDMVTKHPERLY